MAVNALITETDTRTAARILTAAEELVLTRGFKGVTIAEIAERAHVGKGTLYLYWRTKESLFLGLIARSFLAVLAELREEVAADATLARPEHLIPRIVHGALALPLVRALQTSDAVVLGALLDDPRSDELARRHGALGLIDALLPVWRDQGLARTDWSRQNQAYAVQMLAIGYLETLSPRRPLFQAFDPGLRHDTVTSVLERLLRPDPPEPEAPDHPANGLAVGSAVLAVLTETDQALRATLTESSG